MSEDEWWVIKDIDGIAGGAESQGSLEIMSATLGQCWACGNWIEGKVARSLPSVLLDGPQIYGGSMVYVRRVSSSFIST